MTAHVIVGGQYGSEAKGHVAAQVIKACEQDGQVVATVRVGGPNAGHTVVDNDGRPWAFRTIPVSAPISDSPMFIAAGSEIDIQVLADEVRALQDGGHENITRRLYIDRQATIITDDHKCTEIDTDFRGRFGSTAKGIGAARADRLVRKAPIAADYHETLREFGTLIDTAPVLAMRALTSTVVIEGTQGYGLGLHAGHYPFCTAGDCRASDFLAQAGIPPTVDVRPWVVFRTFPIRVAGNSGPMYDETTWEQLGAETDGYVQPERTTVTKLVRRVGRWDRNLAEYALSANGHHYNKVTGVTPVLTFVDYLDPSLAGATTLDRLVSSPAWEQIRRWEMELGCQFEAFTTGPDTVVFRNLQGLLL